MSILILQTQFIFRFIETLTEQKMVVLEFDKTSQFFKGDICRAVMNFWLQFKIKELISRNSKI